MTDILLLSKSDERAFCQQFFPPRYKVRRPKESCPGCVALRDADAHDRFSPGYCSPSCLMRPHWPEDEK